MSNLTVENISSTQEFESLREVWSNLLQRSYDNNIYLTWEWLFTWWKYYGGDKKLNIVLIEDKGKIIGIAPLMRSRYGRSIIKFDVLENICSTNCDYSGVILTERKEESVATLLAYLEKIVNSSNTIVRLSQIPENNDLLALLRRQYLSLSNALIVDERILSPCPYIPLPQTWDDYLRSLRGKRRGTLRRHRRALEKNGTLELRRCDGNDELREQLELLFELHQKRWQAQKLSSKFLDQKTKDFYTDVSIAFSRNRWLDLTFLILNGMPISGVWGFSYNRKFYYMTPAIDPEHLDYNPGIVHILYLIESSIKKGLNEFDFLKGNEEYKRRWTRLSRNNMQIVLVKRRFDGRFRVQLFYRFMRLNEISKRSLRENYYLYLARRRQQKALRLINTSASEKLK